MKRLSVLLFIIPLCSWADITSNLQCHIDFENRYADQSTVGRTINKDGNLIATFNDDNTTTFADDNGIKEVFEAPADTDFLMGVVT